MGGARRGPWRGNAARPRSIARSWAGRGCDILPPMFASRPGDRDHSGGTETFDAAAPPAVEAVAASLPPRFELGRELGQGGMAVVYAAIDHQLGRAVAVKHVRDAGDAARARLRFTREARLVARLRHPAIVTIHDVDPDGAYLVMELVEGGSLADRGRAGPVDVGTIRRWAAQLLEALAVAHAVGIVHRDIKPSNLLLTRAGDLKLADFGVAIDRREGHGADGGRVGTPAYMAPEQRRGEAATPATDVYAVGATLFELITGARPSSDGPDRAGLGRRLRRAGADRKLAAVVARALAVDPVARYPDAEAMQRALATAPTGQRTRAWLALPALAIAGLMAARLGLRPHAGPGPRPGPTVAMLPFVDATGEPGLDYAAYGLPHILTEELQRVPALTLIDYHRLREHVPPSTGDTDDATWRAVARRLGATLLVDGTITGRDPAITLTVRVRTVDGQTLARRRIAVAAAAVPGTLRDLAAPLASALVGRPLTLDVAMAVAPDAERRLQHGVDALARQDVDTAERELDQAVALAPTSAEARYYRAVAAWWMGRSADEVRGQLAAIPVEALAPARRASVAGLGLLIDHRFAEAIAWFDAAVARFPADRDLRYGLFEARFHGGEPAAAIADYRALRAAHPAFGLGIVHVIDYALLGPDDALVSWAVGLAPPRDRVVWAADVAIRAGRYQDAVAAAQAALDRPHPPDLLDEYLRGDLAFAHALLGHLAYARELSPPGSATPRRWALADAVAAPERALEQARYLDRLTTLPPGLPRMTVAMEAAILMLADGRPASELAGAEARLDQIPDERRGDGSPSMVRVLLAIARRDDAALAAAASSPLAEVRHAALAGRAELAGRPDDAAASWQRARTLVIDARLAILEDLTLARLAADRGAWAEVEAACARVLRPPRAVLAALPAGPRCRAWLVTALAARGDLAGARAMRAALAAMRPADDALVAAADAALGGRR